MPRLSRLNNSPLTQFRPPTDAVKPDGPSISFENKKGDIMVFTPTEAKEVLRDYINEELNLYGEKIVRDWKNKLEERINFKIKQFEIGLIEHIDNKINNMTERIVSQTTNRMIEAEVERRLEEKLKKLKDLL